MNTPMLAAILFALYAADRALKWVLVARFFARQKEIVTPPNGWPSVALVQPVTRGATCLAENLAARASLLYEGKIQHIIVCDQEDDASQATCRTFLPGAQIITTPPDILPSPVASKVAKMTEGVKHLENADVVCFVDDDILLPPHALQVLIAPLYSSYHNTKGVAGAAFGLACQTSWNTVWEALMSGFVNANALTGYIPLVYFTPPYTVTGHVFALPRTVFEQIGGMTGLAKRFDDDHEIARRVRALGLPLAQTPLVYRVANALPTARAYNAQLRRWFTIPRQAMTPYLTSHERTVSLWLSIGNLLPALLLLLALASPPARGWAFAAFGLFVAGYVGMERRYLPARTPPLGLWLLPVLAFWTPLQVLFAYLMPGGRIHWRGQTYRARRGGALETEE